MLKYFISTLLFCCFSITLAQDIEKPADSVVYKQKFGLRIGGDAVKLVRTFVDDNYKGFEINADYRLTRNLYVAGELGTEEKITEADYFEAVSSGSYFKAGIDYNVYDNWFGMDNLIFGGLRAGISSFSQERSSFTIYQTDDYWEPLSSSEAEDFSGLSALWAELVFGVKVEVFNNVFIGFNAQLKTLLSQDEPENFENVFIPGFNRTYDSSSIGVGFSYNISYLIPLYKKDK